MTDTVPQAQPFFAAAVRLRENLKKTQMEESAIDFIIGKFVSEVLDRATTEVVQKLGKELGSPDMTSITVDEERKKKIEELYLKMTGKTIPERREEIADQMVAEFEALGTNQ